MAGANAAALLAAGGGAATLSSVSLFSSTFTSTSTIDWPAGIQAGDLAVLTDFAHSVATPPNVVPAGFTATVNVSRGAFGDPRMIESRRILDGSESGTITGMTGIFEGKVLRIFRGDRAIATATPSTWNSEATTGNPAAQNVATPPALSIVLGAAYGSDGGTSFSVASPAFDATQSFGSGNPAISGYKIYNSSPAGHTVDMVDNNINILISGYLALA